MSRSSKSTRRIAALVAASLTLSVSAIAPSASAESSPKEITYSAAASKKDSSQPRKSNSKKAEVGGHYRLVSAKVDGKSVKIDDFTWDMWLREAYPTGSEGPIHVGNSILSGKTGKDRWSSYVDTQVTDNRKDKKGLSVSLSQRVMTPELTSVQRNKKSSPWQPKEDGQWITDQIGEKGSLLTEVFSTQKDRSEAGVSGINMIPVVGDFDKKGRLVFTEYTENTQLGLDQDFELVFERVKDNFDPSITGTYELKGFYGPTRTSGLEDLTQTLRIGEPGSCGNLSDQLWDKPNLDVGSCATSAIRYEALDKGRWQESVSNRDSLLESASIDVTYFFDVSRGVAEWIPETLQVSEAYSPYRKRMPKYESVSNSGNDVVDWFLDGAWNTYRRHDTFNPVYVLNEYYPVNDFVKIAWTKDGFYIIERDQTGKQPNSYTYFEKVK